jgi:hypothetical protein
MIRGRYHSVLSSYTKAAAAAWLPCAHCYYQSIGLDAFSHDDTSIILPPFERCIHFAGVKTRKQTFKKTSKKLCGHF